MYQTQIFAFLLTFCLAEWDDKCRGNVLNANIRGKEIATQQYTHHYTDTKPFWLECFDCVYNAGKTSCSAPSIAIDATCQCDTINNSNCQCITRLSTLSMMVICVATPICTFFSLMLCIFLCTAKNKSSQRANSRIRGFNNTNIIDNKRQVGFSPSANYIPQQRRVPPPPPMAKNQSTISQSTIPQSTLNRTPHYVSRSRQQRL